MIKKLLPVIGILFLISIDGQEVRVRSLSFCAAPEGLTPQLPGSNERLSATTAINKTGPDYPIVVGQDPDNLGVDISIEITSNPMDMTFAYVDNNHYECERYSMPQRGMRSCGEGFSYPYYYYWTSRPCISRPVDVVRPIEENSLKIWLEPETDDTSSWLGNTFSSGKNPLRSLYPEQWSLATWIPGGVSIEDESHLWAGYQIEKFAEENPGFNFLQSDPRNTSILSRTLATVNNPMEIGSVSQTVLALYGDFTARPGTSPAGMGNPCLIKGKTKLADCLISERVYWDRGYSFNDITHLVMTLKSVPLDLPGKWKIGVYFQMRRAKYLWAEEQGPVEQFLTINPSQGYKFEDTAFNSYIWLTTPCNPSENKACENLRSILP